MGNTLLVLGGWGISPTVLRPHFGENALYIDSNTILPHLVHVATLRDNWPTIVAQHLQTVTSIKDAIVVGWSTGAMLAYGAASVVSPKGLLLLSATPSFCRTSTFRYGMRPSVLAAMRERLHTNPQGVLDDFRIRSGLNDSSTALWPVEDLCAGLYFLEQASLDSCTRPGCPIHFIHGERDTIIPKSAGEFFSSSCHAPLTLLAAPHACFTSNDEQLPLLLSTFPEGTNYEPV